MKEVQTNKISFIRVRVTPKELETINAKFSKSTCRKLSEYVRKVLFDKPVTVKQRNQSLDDFMGEMIALRTELNAIGNNYNQVVKRLYTLQHLEEVKAWLLLHETAFRIMGQKITDIKSKINQIDTQWLQ